MKQDLSSMLPILLWGLAILHTLTSTAATINVMGPLVIAPNQWEAFDRQLQLFKSMGVDAVSTDVWWGIVEQEDNRFDWQYYDQISNHIIQAGLKWVPILSFHQCGGNVGDDCNIPIPEWIWRKYIGRGPIKDINSMKYRSEQGNLSNEVVSVWATPWAITDYKEFMMAFHNHFADKASSIAEVNISLGPAGELRYPSYNSHDINSGYPTRGSLQSYSELALSDFRSFTRSKYSSLQRLNEAWGTSLASASEISPPTDAADFFNSRAFISTPYGIDFLTWYSMSLLRHGQLVLKTANHIFRHPQSPFTTVDLGAKVPGIHWRMGTHNGSEIQIHGREAELAAGILSPLRDTWLKDSAGRGYRAIISLFAKEKITLHFTCLEMPDGDGGPEVLSLAKTLVQWVGNEARFQKVHLKGENALSFTLGNTNSWSNMADALRFRGYEGLTLLRMNDIANNPEGIRFMKDFIARAHKTDTFGGSNPRDRTRRR